jgi:hypothetical protein
MLATRELIFQVICRNNGLIIFDGLSHSELQTGRRIEEDISDFANAAGRHGYCRRYVIRDSVHLFAALAAVETECKAGVLLPVLHFDFHGHPESGLLIAESGEFVSWQLLTRYVGRINAATRNNTGLVLAACHGFEVSKHVKVTEPSPFSFVIAAPDEIRAGAMQDMLREMYRETVVTGDLEAGLAGVDESIRSYICAEWFYREMASFMVTQYNQAGRAAIAEEIVTRKVQELGFSNRPLLQVLRKQARKGLKSPEKFFSHISKVFFHGDKLVSWQQFEAFVNYHRPR